MPFECPKLISLELSFLKLKTLDLGITPNLEMLSFSYCDDLAAVHMPTKCLNLRSLELESLKLTTFPFGVTPNLVELTLSLKHLKYLPDSICMLKHLEYLKIRHCDLLEKLPEDIGSISMLKRLKSLEIKSCIRLEKLPEDIGLLECLETLSISGCYLLQDIPNSICEIKHLKYLVLSYCTGVEKLPAEIGCLECLKELDLRGARINHLPHSIYQLKGLRITGSRKIFEAWGITSGIQSYYNKFGTELYSHSVLS